jgi:hypothetical protein
MLLESMETDYPTGFVSPADLRAACAGLFETTALSEKDVTAHYPDSGVSWIKEHVHMLTRIDDAAPAAPPADAAAAAAAAPPK